MSDQEYGFKFQGRGPVCAVQAFATKSGKDIITVVIKLEGKWEQYIPIKCFGNLAEEAAVLKPGQVVAVKGRLGGREWNGKYYGDNVAEELDADPVSGAVAQPEAPPVDNSSDLPF